MMKAPFLSALLLSLLTFSPIHAQETISYSDGEVRETLIQLTQETHLFVSSGSATQSANILGPYDVSKTGAGTLILNTPDADTMSGALILEAGTLRLGDNDQLPSSTLILNGGTLDLANRSQSIHSLSGGGGTVVLDGSSIYLSGGGSFAGSFTSSTEANLTYSGEGAYALTGDHHLQGYFMIDGGSVHLSGTNHFENLLPYQGALIVEGGSTTVSNTFFLTAEGSTPSLELSGGSSVTLQYGLYIGYYEGESGSVTVQGEGSHLVVSDDLDITNAGRGSLTVHSGGTVTATNRAIELAYLSSGEGTLHIGAASGQAALAPGSVVASRVTTRRGQGTLLFNHTSEGVDWGVEIAGRTHLRHEHGTTRLSGTHSYTGGTEIAGGRLLLHGATLGSGAVVVGVEGELGGSGTIGGHTTVSGRLTPEGTASVLTLSQGLTLAPGAVTTMTLGGTTPEAHSRIVSQGLLSFGGTLVLSLSPGFTPLAGDRFALFSFSEATGAFSEILWDDPATVATFDYATGELRLTAIPEPRHLALPLLMLAAALGARRRVR